MAKRAPTLLVIEDAEDQAILVGVSARRAHPGLDVQIVTRGLEGVAYLEGEAPFEDRKAHPLPDLVILDLRLPDIDGLEVLDAIRKRGEAVPYPVVVLTGSSDPEDAESARKLGARGVHVKPDDLGALDELVQAIVHEWIGRGEIIASHIWQSG